MTLHEEIVAEIDAFLARTGMAPSRFGHEAIGDKALVMRLKRGRQLRTDTIEALRLYMHTYRPPRKAAGNGAAVAA